MIYFTCCSRCSEWHHNSVIDKRKTLSVLVYTTTTQLSWSKEMNSGCWDSLYALNSLNSCSKKVRQKQDTVLISLNGFGSVWTFSVSCSSYFIHSIKKITEWIEVCEEAWKSGKKKILLTSSEFLRNKMFSFSFETECTHKLHNLLFFLLIKSGKKENEDRDTKIPQKINDIWKLLSACIIFVRRNFADFF